MGALPHAARTTGRRWTPSKVDFVYVERLDGGGEREHAGPEAVLALHAAGGQWRKIRGRFRVRNRTGQPLWVVLAYFSDALRHLHPEQRPVAAGRRLDDRLGRRAGGHFYLEDAVDQSVERFKLVVATEKVDDFLLAQPALTPGDEYGATRAVDSVEPPRKVALHERMVHQGLPRPVARARATRHRARTGRRCRSRRHHAFIVGIDAYEKVSPLKTAVSDARAAGAGAGGEAALRRASAPAGRARRRRCARCSRDDGRGSSRPTTGCCSTSPDTASPRMATTGPRATWCPPTPTRPT